MAHGGWRAPQRQCRTLEKLKYDSDIHMVQQDLSNTLLEVDVLIMSFKKNKKQKNLFLFKV